MKKFICLILSVLLAFGCCACLAETGEREDHTLEMREYPFYAGSDGRMEEDIRLWFVDGVDDLPFVDLADMPGICDAVARPDGMEGTLIGAYDEEEDVYLLIDKESESFLMFSFEDGAALYSSFDTFSAFHFHDHTDILYHSGINAETDEPELFQRKSTPLMTRPGGMTVIDLDHYQIPLLKQDGKYLLPLHTAMDLVIGLPEGGLPNCFNGEAFFLGCSFFENDRNPDAGLTEVGEIYYGVPKKQRSPEFAMYGLGELCMEMDHFYGLKDAHNIPDFTELMEQTGLYDLLTDLDAAAADEALDAFITFYLDDLHSAYLANSPLTGAETKLAVLGEGFSSALDTRNGIKFGIARDIAFPDGWLYYQEVGDTAFVTFDEFEFSRELDYYSLDLNDPSCVEDTISLIMYAHHQITRENSPIRRVVMDLSNNVGGDADAAVYTIGWFLGDATVTSVSTFTGGQTTGVYGVDTNQDRRFDEKDYLGGEYELYCLTSPVSFSCGNLVPWVFKTSGMVTLVGSATGGGSCVVQQMTTAWGTSFQISGYHRLAFVKNGSFYDVDRGVEPDISLTKTESYYDRELLCRILDESH